MRESHQERTKKTILRSQNYADSKIKFYIHRFRTKLYFSVIVFISGLERKTGVPAKTFLLDPDSLEPHIRLFVQTHFLFMNFS